MIAEAEQEKEVGWCAPDPGSCAQTEKKKKKGKSVTQEVEGVWWVDKYILWSGR